MSFSFKDMFKKISNENEIERVKENLEILKENTYYSQKMIKVGSWTYLVDTEEIIVSDEVYSIYESDYNRLEDSIDGFNLYFHPDDKEEVFRNIKNLMDGKSYDMEFRIVTKRGSVKFINEKTNIIYDKDGKMIKVIGVIQDITEQRIIENDLNEIRKNLINNTIIEGAGNWKYEVKDNKYYWSEEVYNIHGIKPTEFKNQYRNFLKFVHKDDIPKIEEGIAESLKGKALKVDYRILQNDGTIRYFRATGKPMFDRDGEVIELLGSIKDITESKELNQRIENKNKEIYNIQNKFQNIIKESKEGFEIVDMNGIIRYSSDSTQKITGYSPKEMINKTIYRLFTGKDLEIIKSMVEDISVSPNKSIESEVSILSKDGENIFVEVYMTNQLYEPSIRGIVVNFRDITEKVKIQKQLIYDANYDKLTGLKNRNSFLETLKNLDKEAQGQKNKYALMIIELDGLKHVNFSLGHNIGDQLIVQIVNRLRMIFKNDKYISRYSEDDFAIIAEGKSNKEEYESLAEEVINLFVEPFKIDTYEFIIRVNIGVCLFPKVVKDKLPLKNSAKVALIRSKKEGRNDYEFYSPELNIKYYKEFALRNDLFTAIEKEQLEVYYQPLVNINTNEIIAAEALIRWNHPQWGLVPPGEFISIAEETGLIIDVGKWVLKEVCKHYKGWMDKGLRDIKVGINFSGIQFFEKDFVKNIKDTIKQFRLEADFLIMEITESVLFRSKEKVISDINELHSLGIQIALDDFGTGFSSLSYLSKLRIDILKLDRSFIKDIPRDKIGSSITSATVNLAKELKIKFVAEGIENWDQLSYLKALNCTVGQGYIYSKAKPLEEFEMLLEKNKCKPIVANLSFTNSDKDRRKFFRVNFYNLLEGDLTILEIGGEKVDVGNTKVLIKNIGPGGLCFISNIRFPIEKTIILKFTTNLVEEKIVVYGNPVWSEELDVDKVDISDKMYEYGIEFRIDENDREDLVRILNEVQIKMRNNILFAEGSFISGPYNKYFK